MARKPISLRHARNYEVGACRVKRLLKDMSGSRCRSEENDAEKGESEAGRAIERVFMGFGMIEPAAGKAKDRV